MMTKFSLCTYNVHHCYTGAGKYNFDGIVEVLLELKPDILCLQVIHYHGNVITFKIKMYRKSPCIMSRSSKRPLVTKIYYTLSRQPS